MRLSPAERAARGRRGTLAPARPRRARPRDLPPRRAGLFPPNFPPCSHLSTQISVFRFSNLAAFSPQDVDLAHQGDPQMVTEYVNDILGNLLAAEVRACPSRPLLRVGQRGGWEGFPGRSERRHAGRRKCVGRAVSSVASGFPLASSYPCVPRSPPRPPSFSAPGQVPADPGLPGERPGEGLRGGGGPRLGVCFQKRASETQTPGSRRRKPWPGVLAPRPALTCLDEPSHPRMGGVCTGTGAAAFLFV